MKSTQMTYAVAVVANAEGKAGVTVDDEVGSG